MQDIQKAMGGRESFGLRKIVCSVVSARGVMMYNLGAMEVEVLSPYIGRCTHLCLHWHMIVFVCICVCARARAWRRRISQLSP